MEFCVPATEKGFNEILSELIGQTITVFVEGGGMSGAGFTGVLTGVHNDFIRLISRRGLETLHGRSSGNGHHAPGCRRTCGRSQFRPGFCGVKTAVAIPIEKIAALSHNILPGAAQAYACPVEDMQLRPPKMHRFGSNMNLFILLIAALFLARQGRNEGSEERVKRKIS